MADQPNHEVTDPGHLFMYRFSCFVACALCGLLYWSHILEKEGKLATDPLTQSLFYVCLVLSIVAIFRFRKLHQEYLATKKNTQDHPE